MKQGVLLCLLIALFSHVLHAQDYKQFIHKKHQEKVSFLESFLNRFGQEPFDGSYAIVIGIGDYDYLPSLSSPVQDAEKVKNLLLQTGEYDEIILLKDADATFNAIRYFMQEYFPMKMSQGHHRFLFYFTGHGTQIPGYEDRLMGYLQLKKASSQLSNEVINMNQLEDWSDQFRYADHVLFLLDCCFSGLAGIEAKSGDFDISVDPQELAKEKGRFMITAGGADEKAIASLKEWGGSLFTEVVVTGMKGEADLTSDGVVTTRELFTYISQAVKNEAKRQGRTQTPAFRDLGTGREKGEYFFVYQPVENDGSNSAAPSRDMEDKGAEEFEIHHIMITDMRGNIIESVEDVYTVQFEQTVKIEVNITGGDDRELGVAWSAKRGKTQATDMPINQYTATHPGADVLFIEVWDKNTGDELPKYPIMLNIVR